MTNYKDMYFHLAGKTAAAIEVLDKLSEELKEAQQIGEALFVNDGEADAQTKG
ncbi:MAG: hypothetical protein FWE68_04605 [Defluviitaleaceae bacterium]|nr:hypothetical protein [Defluviitaleaceae bacterium]